MSPRFLVIFLSILLLKKQSFSEAEPIDTLSPKSSNPLFKSQCEGYCLTILKPLLDRVVNLKLTAHTSEEWNGKLHFVAETVEKLEKELATADLQIEIKQEIIQVITKKIKKQNENIKIKEDQLIIKEQQIEKQNSMLKNVNNKVNNMTEIIQNLERELEIAENKKIINIYKSKRI